MLWSLFSDMHACVELRCFVILVRCVLQCGFQTLDVITSHYVCPVSILFRVRAQVRQTNRVAWFNMAYTFKIHD